MSVQLITKDGVQAMRFDKNLAHNGLGFKKTFGADHQIVFDFMVYIAYCYQNNLFDFGKLSLANFAKVMGYDRANLAHPHPDPEQMKGKKRLPSSEIPMLTIADNALFLAMKYNLLIPFTYVDPESRTRIDRMESIQLLKSVEKVTGPNGEVSYNFEVNNDFKSALNRYFLVVKNPLGLKPLRKKNMMYLYHYLADLEENLKAKKEYIGRPAFDMICEFAEIDIVNPADKKKKLIKKLTELMKLNLLNFSFEFYKAPNDKFAYELNIYFHSLQPNSQELKNKEIEGFKNLSVAFRNLVDHKLYEWFKENYAGKTIVDFNMWRSNELMGKKEKQDIIVAASKYIYGEETKHSSILHTLEYLKSTSLL